MSGTAHRAFPLLLALACAGLFTALWLDYRSFWLDDAFITLRYARNLAQGLGPVFNPGEAVEGYTNFLWMLLAALPLALLPEAAALWVVKGAGLALGLCVLWRVFTFPGPSGEPRRRPVAAALFASHPVVVANSGDGLETPLFALLLLEGARAALRPPSVRSGAWAGALAAAAAWTRPDALPLLLAWPVLVLLCHRAESKAGRGFAAGFAAAALPPVVGQLAFRITYYGAVWPNTFYAKASGALLPRLQAGLSDLASFAGAPLSVPAVGLWLALGLALAGVVAARSSGAPSTAASARARVFALSLWGLVGFRVAFDLWSGSEFMGVFRFLAPALPPLFVLADEGARRLGARLPALDGALGRGLLAAACAIAVVVGVAGHRAHAGVRRHYAAGLERAHFALGAWLRGRPPDTLVALGDAGIIPFVSRLPVIDLWGLADAEIARLPGEYGSRAGTAEVALRRDPDLVVLWNVVPIAGEPDRPRIVGANGFEREIAAHPDFARRYRFVREFVFREESPRIPGYYLDVFERRRGALRQPPVGR